jgi:hypothetical protein
MLFDQKVPGKTFMFVLILLISFSLASFVTDRKKSWQADPEEIKANEERYPDLIWHESQVPDFVLPDPLQREDGTTVENKIQWQQHRQQLLEMFRHEMFGRSPGLPQHLNFLTIQEDTAAMEGMATLRRISIESIHHGRQHDFELTLFLPNRAKKPVPVFLLLNNRTSENTDPTRKHKSEFWPAEEVIARGYGIAAIQNNALSPDDQQQYTEGIIRLFEGDESINRSPHAWGAIAAWSWGARRAMDYFETDNQIDESRIALLGHSRGGKASLWAGAEDERFALVISNQSGSGGSALSRRRFGEDITTLNRFTHWFTDHFKKYNGQEEQMPFDQHFLISLIAPRAVYIGSADKDLWADPHGEYLGLAYASSVYALWNYTPIEHMPPTDTPVFYGPRAYHVRSGIHNLNLIDWNYYMDFAHTLWSTKNP